MTDRSVELVSDSHKIGSASKTLLKNRILPITISSEDLDKRMDDDVSACDLLDRAAGADDRTRSGWFDRAAANVDDFDPIAVHLRGLLKRFSDSGQPRRLQRQRGEGRFLTGLEVRGVAPGRPSWRTLTIAKAIQKIAMNAAANISYDKLVLSQKNVRRVKDGVSIDELAEDIGRRKLLQSLNVRPVLGESGEETGTFEVPAGGRRYLALGILIKQKRLAKNEPIPCIVNRSGATSAEEDSLAENVHRQQLHPLDQFRAFMRTAVSSCAPSPVLTTSII